MPWSASGAPRAWACTWRRAATRTTWAIRTPGHLRPRGPRTGQAPHRLHRGARARRPGSIGPQLKAAFGGVYVANEGLDFGSAGALIAAGEADAVAFGRLFIANPDLPRRFATGAPLNAPDPATFYCRGAKGYTDYPALD